MATQETAEEKRAREYGEELNLIWGTRIVNLEDFLLTSALLTNAGELEAAKNTAEQMLMELTDELVNLQKAVDRPIYLDRVTRLQDCRLKVELVRNRSRIADKDPNAFNTGDASNLTINTGFSMSRKANTRLPKLEFSKFDGSALKYNAFMDMFNSSVGNNPDLTDIEKFQYLKSACTHDAEALIQAYPLTKEAYPLAIAALLESYGSEDTQRNALFRALEEIKGVTVLYPVKPAQDVLTKINSTVRTLEQLKVPMQVAGMFLVPQILGKFPAKIARKYYEKYEGTREDVLDLLTFLAKEIRLAEKTEVQTLLEIKKGNAKFPPKVEKVVKETKGSMAACASTQGSKKEEKSPPSKGNTQKSEKPTKLECIFCAGSHYNASCDAKLTVPERFALVRQKRLCFNCLRPNHSVRACQVKFSCRTCGARHHSLICNKKAPAAAETKTEVPKGDNVSANVSLTVSSHIQLKVFSAYLVRKDGTQQLVRGLLDSGSHRSYVTKRLVNELGLKSRGKITVATERLYDESPFWQEYSTYDIELKSRFSDEKVTICAFEAPKLPRVEGVSGYNITTKIKGLNLELAEEIPSNSSVIDVLVGGDVLWEIGQPGRKAVTRKLGLVKTIFGWVTFGASGSTDPFEEEKSEVACTTVSCLAIEDKVEKLWSLDSIGISSGEKSSDFVRDRFEEKTQRLPDGRYQVELPFNRHVGQLDSNWSSAINQLAATLKKLDSSSENKKRYDDAMNAYLEEDHAEIVPEAEMENKFVYYIPHHPVIKEDRDTTKFRIVFNASSAKKGCLSLNECLYPGPSLNPDIVVVSLRFRLVKVVVISDIKQAFLQVAIAKKHRDVLRFLWVKKNYFQGAYSWASVWNNLLVLRMVVVPFGVNASPFLLCASIRKQAADHKEKFPKEAEALDQGIYMDDLTSGADDDEGTIQHSILLEKILGQAKMPLVKWATNSETVHENLKKKGFHMRSDNFSEIGCIKMLGISWSVPDDSIVFEQKNLDAKPRSKREVLASVAEIFDPLGLLAPVVLAAKQQLQRLWSLKLGWDVDIPEAEQKAFSEWNEDMQKIKDLKIPRWVGTISNDPLRLDIYCDASPIAYGCAAYFTGNSGAHHLMMSKSRLAPLAKITLPRLELTAAVLGVRLAKYIQENMPGDYPIGEVKFHSDSMITLAWIKSKKNEWKPYVSNRIEEILKNSKPEQWYYVPTKQNPADVLTRPIGVDALIKSPLWWRGTDYSGDSVIIEVNLPDEEKRKPENISLTIATSDLFLNKFVRRFSNWKKLKRIFGFIHRWRSSSPSGRQRSLEEMEVGERMLIKLSQRMYFPDEIADLEEKSVVSKKSITQKLDPFIGEQGVMRAQSRLGMTDLTFDEKFPIIMHPSCWITRLLIREIHASVGHGDTSETLYRTRDKFWIIRGRRTVQSVVRDCPICRKSRLDKNDPLTGDPPIERLTPAAPFKTIGIDFFGPIMVKEGKAKPKKVQVLLITCMVTRALHLEVVLNFTVEKFLLAFRRFTSRFGLPAKIFSDNAQTFKRGQLEIDSWGQLIAHQEIKSLLTDKGIEWSFSPPRAPWWGGIWERLVRVVKDKMRRLYGRQLVDLETLQTNVLEISSIINSRPLSYVHESIDGGFILSPEHFLTGGMPKLLINKNVEAINRKDLKKLERKRRAMTFKFWEIWRNSYLKQLRNLHEVHGDSEYRNLKQGQVVLVERTGKNPYFWPLARIKEVYPGSDGIVRVVRVIDADGHELVRSVKHLRLLESD